MAKPTNTTQLNTWDSELAEQAKIAAAAEASTVERTWVNLAGALSVGDVRQPNDQLAVVVLDNIHVNAYYTQAYNAATPSSPGCFALGRALPDGTIEGLETKTGTTELAPHKDVTSPVCETCAACPKNQFGTATSGSGKGKACQNTRRLAMVPAGSMSDGKFKPFDARTFGEQKLLLMKLSPTNGKPFGAHVQNVAAVASRPLYATYTVITRKVHAVNQYQLDWVFAGKIPDTHKDATLKHLDLAKASIVFGFTQDPEKAEVPNTPGKPKGKSKY